MLKSCLPQIWDLPMHEQKNRIENEILTWKGDLEQVDDIMFIGTKIPEHLNSCQLPADRDASLPFFRDDTITSSGG